MSFDLTTLEEDALLAKEVLAAIASNREVRLSHIKSMLPDEFNDSEAWKTGNCYDRIEWLKATVGAQRIELEKLYAARLEHL